MERRSRIVYDIEEFKERAIQEAKGKLKSKVTVVKKLRPLIKARTLADLIPPSLPKNNKK